jgi:hypothetical protein
MRTSHELSAFSRNITLNVPLIKMSETDAKHVIAMEAIHRDPATAVSCFAEKRLLELAQMYLMSCEFKQ